MAEVVVLVTLDIPEIEENVLHALDSANYDMDIEREIHDSVESTINDRLDTLANSELGDAVNVELLDDEKESVVDDILQRLEVTFNL